MTFAQHCRHWKLASVMLLYDAMGEPLGSSYSHNYVFHLGFVRDGFAKINSQRYETESLNATFMIYSRCCNHYNSRFRLLFCRPVSYMDGQFYFWILSISRVENCGPFGWRWERRIPLYERRKPFLWQPNRWYVYSAIYKVFWMLLKTTK